MKKYPEYKNLDLVKIAEEILTNWERNDTFKKSINSRSDKPSFTFYEGPPSANGVPGIHHVMGRAIKDIFCRFKTLKGYQVHRKAGWDTHGLPVELSVEKELGITKEDVGKKLSIEEYNKKCRENVMKYKGVWEDLTKKMGYWVDLSNPYITYDNKYIESVWWLLSEINKKNMLYKGHTIQPFSPKAGTGLSSHELNQPGCYRSVKDVTAVAQFKLIKNSFSEFLFDESNDDIYLLAWTTTPWTLPSNTALAVGKNIKYLKVKTFNQYTHKPITVIIAKELFDKYFNEKNKDLKLEDYVSGDKNIPFKIITSILGKDLDGLYYEQLLKYEQPKDGDAFKVILADFVTTEDGTGIVHLAPSFGADDSIAAKQNNIGSLTLVDKQGRFVDSVTDFAGMYVKNEYYEDGDEKPNLSADIQIVILLKEKNLCFKSEKYEHSYPHCWRTDKPILYYPLESWFVKTTAKKDKMVELNNTINWKPSSTGEGRFGNWLENLVDWNLSRSRFWGIPLPIWTTEDKKEMICIGSIEELKIEIEKSINSGFMTENFLSNFSLGDMSNENYEGFDLHRPFVDDIILVSNSGKKMKREKDLIDVWFDSGSMPYAQMHYPFENKELFESRFPANFIAEGVDQTRGWFFTLHAISSILFESVAFKNVISNGLVLDKNGNKMSKRLGNAIDPFETLNKYGADATRWYMISNAQPWDNLKFDLEGIDSVRKKFFGTLYNTYAFFALYANIDDFENSKDKINIEERPEIDRWILSELNSLINKVSGFFEHYEPTKAARSIQEFVLDNLSNWYVRLCRRRFWKGEFGKDKLSAYQTLYECLEVVSILSSPIAPFFMDKLFLDLNKNNCTSVHLTKFPKADNSIINLDLEKQMRLAQDITSMVLSLRKKEQIRVRQPLQKIMIPILNEDDKSKIVRVKKLILSEVNVKEIEFITEDSGILIKKIKPNFKSLGPKYGKYIKQISNSLNNFKPEEITAFELAGFSEIKLENKIIKLEISDVEIYSEDIPGWTVASMNGTTVALDINITDQLEEEGLAREFINRIQNLRKDSGLNVTDKILIEISSCNKLTSAINNNLQYICSETLADNISFVENVDNDGVKIDLINEINARIILKKKN